ncbi:cytochrome P450 [Sphingobium estronivorans]|uniref:cytochrome P450 n=1 Tax=Sphingobium estronivorans TaxID=1577690 RepID=UPI0019683163|nr:cytochrome P450 [Sphingobium estronivorans]
MPAVSCPVHDNLQADADRRRSVAGAGALPISPEGRVTGFAAVREVLRVPGMRQAGFKAELVQRSGGLTRPPILFLSGEAHRRQRAATARFFAPRVVEEKHRPLIEEHANRLIERLQRDGQAKLDTMALDLAVAVAGEIVGLTQSDRGAMARRLDAFFSVGTTTREGRFAPMSAFLKGQWRMLHFHFADVRPAIAARRKAPREDVISHLIAEGYTPRDILVECFTYGAAGMVTTREFITMAAWHLLDDAELRARFLAADRTGRIAVLEEILRLEPVVGYLYRCPADGGPPVELDIRSANADVAAVGACPFKLDPDRQRAERVGGAGMAFGDGEHRCPGAGVALAEAEIFLNRLLRVPGLRLEQAPRLGWNPLVTGYELRDCRVAVGRVAAGGEAA